MIRNVKSKFLFTMLLLSLIFISGFGKIANADEFENPQDIASYAIEPDSNFIPIIGDYDVVSTKRMLRGTAPTIITYGPFYYNIKGSSLNSWAAKHAPANLNLDSASRKAVLSKYGSINTKKTYKIKWYNRVEQRISSVNGKIVNYSCIN